MRSSYSGIEIPKGTGFMYVKKDGTVLYFTNQKEFKNWKMKRVGKKLKWIRTKKKVKSAAAPAKKEAVKEPKKEAKAAEVKKEVKVEDKKQEVFKVFQEQIKLTYPSLGYQEYGEEQDGKEHFKIWRIAG